MSRLRWQLRTTATHAMADLWQYVKPHGQFVLFGEYGVGFCPAPKPRGRKTPNLERSYSGQNLAMRPDEKGDVFLLEPVIKRSIAIWPAWAVFAVQCIQHQLAPYVVSAAESREASACEGQWMYDGCAWAIIGPTKRHKTTLYQSDGNEATIPDSMLVMGHAIDSLIPVVWHMFMNHSPLLNGQPLPARSIPEHVIEAYYEQHPYKRPRAKTPACTEYHDAGGD